MPHDQHVAVLGLGIIGNIWTENWLSDGVSVKAWNRTPKPACPVWSDDLIATVQDADVICMVLSDGPVTKHILETILPHLRPNAIVAQHATIAVAETKALAQLVQGSGRRYVDMPFTGSKPAAEDRQTVFFVGDDDDTLPRIKDLYASLCQVSIPIGQVGDAAGIKLAMNLNIAGTYQAMAESFALTRAIGIPDETYWHVLGLNISKSGLADLKKLKMINGDWSPQFSVKHLHKDLSLALEVARDVDRHLPQTERLQQSYTERLAGGDGDLDFAALLKLVDPSSA